MPSSSTPSPAACLLLLLGAVAACSEDPESASGSSPDSGSASGGRSAGAGGVTSSGGRATSTGGRPQGGASSSGGATTGDASTASGGSTGDAGAPADASSDAPTPPTSIVKKPFAVGSHWNEASKYAAMRVAGVQMIRIDLDWDHMEPSRGAFSWGPVDTAMDEAEAQGIEVLAVLGYTNDWASSGSGRPGEIHQYAPLEEFDDEWGHYIQETVSRYGDRVTAWEIWNEPDHDNFLRMAPGTWAENRHGGESAEMKKRLQYKHLLDIALSQPAFAGKLVTTSGFAEGGGYDEGFRAWLEDQPGFLAQFDVASFHTYGYPSYQRLVDVPASYRQTQAEIGKPGPWPFWITEHGINTTGVPSGTVKTYLIRSYATALAQPGVEKLFWFRAGYDPGHMDLFDASSNTTPAYDAFRTLTGKWTTPTTIVPWSAAGSARGSIATLSSGRRVAIVWSDGDDAPLSALGLDIQAAHDQDGDAIATSTALTEAPVFLELTD